MSSYDPERDPVRMAGRVLRWAGPWVVLPAAIGMLVSGNIDLRSIPVVVVFCAFLGLLLGFTSRRLLGDYLAIVTLFFFQIFSFVLASGVLIDMCVAHCLGELAAYR